MNGSALPYQRERRPHRGRVGRRRVRAAQTIRRRGGEGGAALWRSVFGIGEGDAELLERLIREQLVQAQPKEQEGKTPPEGLPEVIRRWELVIPSFRGPNGNVGPVLTAWALDPDVGQASPHLVNAFPLL